MKGGLKMNKKLLLTFGLVGLLAITLVSAAILSYYGMLEETVSVTQPITVNGEEEYYFVETIPIDCYAGDTCNGTLLSIKNNGNNNVPIEVTTSDNEEITTLFFSETQLTKKNVVFGETNWNATGDPLTLRYAAVGDSFIVEVTNPIEGYELIYYKDNSDRFDTPAQAIRVSDVTGMLPYADDANAMENEYCSTGEYLTCNGAKLWYVPSTAILAGEELNWGRASEFYFETELIQFNNVGEFIMYPGQTLDLTPSYQVDALAGTDDIIVNISIIPSTA